jgi:transposase
MRKHTLEFKLKVIEYYMAGTNGIKVTAKRFGIEGGVVRQWVATYKHHGVEGLSARFISYTAEFKESVILHRRQNQLSARETAALLNIPTYTLITRWEHLYNEGGIEALKSKRGRPKKIMPKPVKPPIPKSFDEMTLEELHTELQHLRMENAYLKKLKALVLQDILPATKSKRR